MGPTLLLLLSGPGGSSGGGGPVVAVDLRSALYKSLANDPAIVAVVGSRVYPTFLPQTGKHPCVVFTVISDVRAKGLSGTLGAATARVQFDLRAYRLSDAVALKEALRLKWEGYRGEMQGLEVLWAEPVSEHDFARDPEDASDDRPVVIEVDYFFKYRQSLIPSPTG